MLKTVSRYKPKPQVDSGVSVFRAREPAFIPDNRDRKQAVMTDKQGNIATDPQEFINYVNHETSKMLEMFSATGGDDIMD
jgi:polyhydroxyalkanoate synthase